MLELREDSAFHHMWFVGARGVDWLAFIFKHANEPWKCVYRFRYHKDDLTFDSDDEKSWTCITTDSTEPLPPAQLVQAISKVAGMTAAFYGGEIHSVPIRGNGKDAFEALKSQPWAFVRIEGERHDAPGDTEAR